MWLQTMPADQAERLRDEALRHPAAAEGVSYPDWYFKRWHFLPEGYLSERSTTLYDRVIRPVYWAGSEGRVARLIARWLERTGARRVLELAPGPGRLLARLSERLPGVEFRAVELSPYFVAGTRARRGNAAVVHGDARRLEQVAGVFDAVIETHYVGHLPAEERGLAFAAAVRAARPGGSIVTVEHRWHAWPVPPGVRTAAVRGAGFSRVTFYRRDAGQEAQP
ncbi:MAG: hypothetical protein KatS3mg064_0813 [Tepidiforma sp.]|nr:class I SAM-dependent methyltransferase [Tepidiforma sp.]GIW17656.1 MAG: hypothetical protein KatS3mg064_0813 [Tepidiforma sp.]